MATSFKDLNIEIDEEGNGLKGDKISIKRVFNREIKVHEYKIKDSKIKVGEKCLWLQISINEIMYVMFTGSGIMQRQIQKVAPDDFPIITTIIDDNGKYRFT